jgi:hypothetical protein
MMTPAHAVSGWAWASGVFLLWRLFFTAAATVFGSLRCWSHDSFLDRGAYLMSCSHPIAPRQTSHRRDGPSQLRCCQQAGSPAGRHAWRKPFWHRIGRGSTLLLPARGGNLALEPGSRWTRTSSGGMQMRSTWTASFSASLTPQG